MTTPFTPVSSSNSRMAVSSRFSRKSIKPPGSAHSPMLGWFPRNSSEIHLKISDRLPEYLPRRPHGPKDCRSQKDARCGQDDPCSHRDRNHRMDCLPYALLIPGTEKLGDDDAGAGRRANAESAEWKKTVSSAKFFHAFFPL